VSGSVAYRIRSVWISCLKDQKCLDQLSTGSEVSGSVAPMELLSRVVVPDTVVPEATVCGGNRPFTMP
jgi:hypothetical protein